MSISPQVFGLCLALGGAVIALWVDFRFPKLAPTSLRGTFVHTALAFVVLAVVPFAIRPVFSAPQSFVVELFAVLAVVLPALVYAFLAFAWLVKPLASGLTGR